VETVAVAPNRRVWNILQIAAVLITIEGALWSQGKSQGKWFVVAFATLIAAVLLNRPKVRDLGVGLRGIGGAAWVIPLAFVVCAATIGLAIWFGTFTPLYGRRPVYWHAIFYAIWALEQQFILNSFFYKRFESLLGNTTLTVAVTAALFAFVHLPNPVLMPATFLGGLLFVEAFRRWRNIYPLAIAHAMFGLTLAVTFPDHWIRHMRVGLAFFTFHPHG
jgi:Type II CAAX prenyl endopeptidase Rce1-like